MIDRFNSTDEEEFQRRLDALALLEDQASQSFESMNQPDVVAPRRAVISPVTEKVVRVPISQWESEASRTPPPSNTPVNGPKKDLESAYGVTPKPAPKVATQQPSLSDLEELDRQEHNRRVIEAAGRQFVAGVTRTPVQPIMAQEGQHVARAKKSAAEARLLALRELEAGNEAARFKAGQDERTYQHGRDVKEDEFKASKAKTDEELRRAAIAASNANAAATRSIAQAHLGLAAEAAGQKREEKAAKKAALDMPFRGGILRGGEGVDETGINKVRESSGKFNAALGSMDDLESSLSRFVSAPSLEAKNDVESRLQTTATALNAALGQGAMSEAERANIAKALGTDLLSPTGLATVLQTLSGESPDQAGKLLLSRLRAARDVTEKAALKSFEPYRYKFERSPAPSGGSSVKMKFPDGSTHDVPAEKVDLARRKGGVQL